jgi:Leucine-rich repeat (LRR) protein
VKTVLLLKSVFVSDEMRCICTIAFPGYVSSTNALWFCNSASTGNDLIGELPPEMSLLTDLKRFLVPENALMGNLDVAFAGLTSLETIAMPDNRLSGTVPTGIFENNTNLTLMTVAGNSFTGHIPSGISAATKLYELKLSRNQLTGTIPSEIGRLVQLSKHFMIIFIHHF